MFGVQYRDLTFVTQRIDELWMNPLLSSMDHESYATASEQNDSSILSLLAEDPQ